MALLMRRASMEDRSEEILRAIKANKWTLGYIAMLATAGVLVEIIELVKG